MANDEPGVWAAEDRFFGALLAADGPALEEVLADDFVLIDVMTGSETLRDPLVEAVGSRQLVFEQVDRAPGRVRQYGPAAVVVGETRLHGRFGEETFAAHSRYSHVYVQDGDRWRLVCAQGTRITPAVR